MLTESDKLQLAIFKENVESGDSIVEGVESLSCEDLSPELRQKVDEFLSLVNYFIDTSGIVF